MMTAGSCASRAVTFVVIGALATLMLAGCGSTGGAHSAPLVSTSTLSPTQAVEQAWTDFFNGASPAAIKIPLLQNGQMFASVLEAQAQSPLAKGSTAQVTSVTMEGTDKATVNYSILIGGTPALADQTGTAVLTNGQWQVADASFCSLLSLEGSKVPACSS